MNQKHKYRNQISSLINRTRRIMMFILCALMTVSCLAASVSAEESSGAYDSYIFGMTEEYSTFTPGKRLTDSFYYSDDWFLEDPEIRNDSLALLSMQLTAAVVEGDSGGAGAQMLEALGFGSPGFSGFASEDPDDCAYTWALKQIGDVTLAAVVVQSYSFDALIKEKGWKQNFHVNDDTAQGEHYAFAKAVDQVIDDIASLAGSGKVKFWIMGQSRGGALANLIAAHLPDHLDGLGASDEGVYAYTFEAPAVVDEDAVQDTCGYIHNYLCSDDVVTAIPMWGMVRYGNVYELKTEETDAGLQEELTKLRSPAADIDYMQCEDEMRELISRLEERVSAGPDGDGTNRREDYSRIRNDEFTDLEGNEVNVTYSWQDTLVRLMGVIFSGELSGIDTDRMESLAEGLGDSLFAYADGAVLEESGDYDAAMPYYWKAACGLHRSLDELAGNTVSLEDADFYSLLRLLGPMAINTAYERTGEDPMEDIILYITPLMEALGLKDGIVYSHHFDTLIARLKTLAPQPDLEDIDISVTDPEAGDPADQLPKEVTEYIESMGYPWLCAEEAEWDTEEDTLQEGQVYYLRVRLKVVGHKIPDDFEITVNGKLPAEKPTASYEEGAGYAECIWEYEIGTAEDVQVSFETGKSTKAPEAFTVKKGKSLRFAERPEFPEMITEQNRKWKFRDWQDEDGNYWDDIKAVRDMTLHAVWNRVIDDVQISFRIPGIGETPDAPQIANDIPCRIFEYDFYDEMYNTVETITKPGTYRMNIFAEADPEKGVFAAEPDEEGEMYIYTGTCSVNGILVECFYDDSGELPYLSMEFEFTVSEEDSPDDPDPRPAAPSYFVSEGMGQVWKAGSGKNAEFVFKRTVDDDKTYDHFAGIEVDGKKVGSGNYTSASGSVVIALKASYLETLKPGDHTLRAVFDDGSAEADFRIIAAGEKNREQKQSAKKSPATADSTNTALWTFILIISLCLSGCAAFVYGKFS